MKKASPVRQVHVRVSATLKKAIKMLCVRTGTTEQAWVHGLIEERLKRKPPDLWPGGDTSGSGPRKSSAR